LSSDNLKIALTNFWYIWHFSFQGSITRQKTNLYEIFELWIFHQEHPSVPLIDTLNVFRSKFIFAKVIKEVHSAYNHKTQKLFFSFLEQDDILFLIGLGPIVHPYSIFWSKTLVKAVKKIISFWIIEFIWTHVRNRLDESVHILRTRGMKLNVYRAYAEWICALLSNKQIEVNLGMDFWCAYSQNVPVCVLRIHGITLNVRVYWDSSEQICTKIENTQNAWN
jgi:hypothetical protein